MDRFVQGLSALFLAVRRRPVIRYQRGSDNAQRLADSLYQLTYKQARGGCSSRPPHALTPPPSLTQQYKVFDFGARTNAIVLILDRKDDLVTPLLTQWTYQAMLHEMIGIKDNTIELTSAKVWCVLGCVLRSLFTPSFISRCPKTLMRWCLTCGRTSSTESTCTPTSERLVTTSRCWSRSSNLRQRNTKM